MPDKSKRSKTLPAPEITNPSLRLPETEIIKLKSHKPSAKISGWNRLNRRTISQDQELLTSSTTPGRRVVSASPVGRDSLSRELMVLDLAHMNLWMTEKR